MDPLPSFNKAYSTVIREERHQIVANGRDEKIEAVAFAARTNKKQSLLCSICSKLGTLLNAAIKLSDIQIGGARTSISWQEKEDVAATVVGLVMAAAVVEQRRKVWRRGRLCRLCFHPTTATAASSGRLWFRTAIATAASSSSALLCCSIVASLFAGATWLGGQSPGASHDLWDS